MSSFACMILFPNSKINLGLHVTSKLSDGFHSIETVFYPIQWQDILEIVPNKNTHKKIEFTTSGIPIDGNFENNLCIKAYNLLDAEFKLPPVRMHLHKIIPMGAGLGGGSADAAYTLKILNLVFELGLSNNSLAEYASKLGSDCAFFIHNKPIFAKGKGNIFSEINLCLKDYWLLVVKPNVHVNTGDAYAGVTPKKPTQNLYEVLKQNPKTWNNILVNDFEESIFLKHPTIKNIKEKMYNAGAMYSSMSGSGAAVYGIFNNEPNAEYFKDYTIWKEELL
jgi:4-diphosphocytidyl-2-C-methyl-D-erythritol kinase